MIIFKSALHLSVFHPSLFLFTKRKFYIYSKSVEYLKDKTNPNLIMNYFLIIMI